MKTLRSIDDRQLRSRVKRLKRDVEDFRQRADKEARALESAGRCAVADPLHQRLSSILAYLRDELVCAEEEVERRARAAAAAPPWSLKAALRELVYLR